MKKLLKFLAGIWAKISELFNGLPAELKKAVTLGVFVTENLKLLVDSPVADVITALIPGEADDKLKAWLRSTLPGILISLRLVNGINPERLTPEQIIRLAAKALQALDGDAKKAALHNIAIMIAKARADGKLSWSDGVYLLEWVYQQKKAA